MIAQSCEVLREKLSIAPQKIYQLSEALTQAKVYDWARDPHVALYQKLFLTQAALCELYFEYELNDSFLLHLTPVLISVRPRGEAGRSNNEEEQGKDMRHSDEALSPNVEFFAEHRNFFDVSASDVKALLAGFWTRYEAHFSVDESFAVLEIEASELSGDISNSKVKAAIRHAYQRAAAKHHPDRGGDPARFVQVRQAYERLKAL